MNGGFSSSGGDLVFTTNLAGWEAGGERLHSPRGQMGTLWHRRGQQVVGC